MYFAIKYLGLRILKMWRKKELSKNKIDHILTYFIYILFTIYFNANEIYHYFTYTTYLTYFLGRRL